MKKTIYFLAGILIAGTLLFVFSCSKEEIKNENQNQPAQTTFGQQIFKAIKDFKQKVAYYEENAIYKSGETVSADSVLFVLEGTINYSHAFMTDSYNEELIENLTLVVPKTGNGDVDMDVLIQKYLDMKADITTVYYASNFENKGLVAVDLTETARDEDEITFNVDVITGDRNNDPPPGGGYGVDGPFEAGDNWWYGENEGKCYDPISVSDAAEQLEDAMSDYIYDYNQSHGIMFLTPLTLHKFQGGDPYLKRPTALMDNHCDYYMYNAWESIGISDDTLCVEWPEMNLYFQYLKYWLYNKMKDSLQSTYNLNYQPAQVINMIGDKTPSADHYYHLGYFLFGNPWYYDEGEEPEEL